MKWEILDLGFNLWMYFHTYKEAVKKIYGIFHQPKVDGKYGFGESKYYRGFLYVSTLLIEIYNYKYFLHPQLLFTH